MPPISNPKAALDPTVNVEELVQVADVLPDAILRFDEQWRLVYANAAGRADLGISEERRMGATLWEMYPALVGSELEQLYKDAVASKQPRYIPAHFYAPSQRWSEVYVFPLERGAVVYYRDITARKQAEEARDRADNRRLQVLEAATDAILALDLESHITYINRRAMKLLGADKSVLGKSVRECFPQVLYGNSSFVEGYRRALHEGLAEFEAFYPEPLNLWLQVSARPSEDGIIVFFRDVTQQKRTAEAMMQAEKLAAVGRLASSIAHEINNPLDSVTNLIYLARQQAQQPETRQYLKSAEQELRRASIIVNQTLRFHRQSTRPRAIGCAELFTAVLDMYGGKLKNSGIAVEKRQCAHTPVVCFEGEIRQVLNNLVGNAIDAMPSGGRLLLRSRDGTDWKTGRAGLVLTVADTGCGIDPQTQRKMFDAFFTTKGAGGTGLGLWVSSEIVKRHHGGLRVRSSRQKPHRGTVITLFLPYPAEGAEPAPSLEPL